MAVPTSGFPQFSKLPSEIRQEIFACCIPRRFVMPFSLVKYKEASGGSLVKAKENFRPPLISRVCKEARAIALMNGSLISLVPGCIPMWFAPKFDAITVDFTYYRDRSIQKEEINAGSSVRQSLFYSPDIPLSIGVCNLPYLKFDDTHVTQLVHRMLDLMLVREDCTVVLFSAPIRMSHRQACNSGFFGLFGEQKIAHINIGDSRRIKKLLAVWEKADRAPWVASISQRLDVKKHLAKGTLGNFVACFLRCVKTELLMQHKLLPLGFEPRQLTPKIETIPEYEKVLERLPKFNFVVAINLWTV